jgi:hypothetical protein
MKNKQYWLFVLNKAFRTGLQSAISLYLANSTGSPGIIDAQVMELVGVAFLTSALSVLQNGLEQYKPKQTFEDVSVENKEKQPFEDA